MSSPPREFVFVLEQTLGNAIHGRKIERALTQEDGIAPTVIRIEPRPSGLGWRLPVLRSWSFQASTATRSGLRKRLRQGRPEVIYINTQVSSLLSCAIMRSVPTVLSMDATPINYDTMAAFYGHKRQGAVVEECKRRVNRRAFASAAAIITFSRWAADSVVNDYGIAGDRVHVIPYGVDLERFRPGPGMRRPGPPRILFVGGDFVRKGGPDLIEAMRRLGGRAELDIVTASSPAPLPEGLTVRVHVGLTHDTEELFDLYRNADIFAFPSRGDCLPNAICEAVACGLPVVACAVGAIGEVAVEGRNALLVPTGSPEALAAALGTLVDNPDQRRAFADHGRRLAERELDNDRNIRAIFEVMGEVAHRRAQDVNER